MWVSKAPYFVFKNLVVFCNQNMIQIFLILNHFLLWSVPIHIKNFMKICLLLLEQCQPESQGHLLKNNIGDACTPQPGGNHF